jgi:pyridoxal biosynthesis lyase PdxS
MTEKITVPAMLRTTGENTKGFMDQVAEHIEKLEGEIIRLTARVNELEATEGK